MVNLVRNEITDEYEEEGYVYLEFRQNAFDDPKLYWGSGLVSFKLESLTEEELSRKGLKIRINSEYNGEKFIKVEFKDQNSGSVNAQKAAFSAPVTFQ